MVPTTFVARIVLLPIWLHMLAHKSLNFIFWIPSSVVVFCFYPFIQAFWVTRDQPLFSRLLFAMETALPYAFTGMIYGEMMNATAGLGFCDGKRGRRCADLCWTRRISYYVFAFCSPYPHHQNNEAVGRSWTKSGVPDDQQQRVTDPAMLAAAFSGPPYSCTIAQHGQQNLGATL
jgi:hypothetical protein